MKGVKMWERERQKKVKETFNKRRKKHVLRLSASEKQNVRK
jgi:hypothetical protein